MLVIGVDEAGRGPLVGSVVAAAVAFPPGFRIDGLTDSKKLSEKKEKYSITKLLVSAIGLLLNLIAMKSIKLTF